MGKTAGGTIYAHFKKQRLNYEQVHLHAVDKAMLQNRDVIILSLRQPEQRLVSAFNYHNPKNEQEDSRNSSFYEHFENLDQYAHALTESSEWGKIARMGFGHLQMNTCAYLGGVTDILKEKASQVFVVKTTSVVEDLNAISARLKWGRTFVDNEHKHKYVKPNNLTYISMAGMMKLTGYVEAIGEGPLYRELIHAFRMK